MNDMLERYGEVCTQKEAARLLNVQPRSIHRMMEQGRLRRVGHRVDVRSIAEYIENCGRGLPAPRRRNSGSNQRGEIREGDVLTVFGKYSSICRAFHARERFTDQ